MSDRLLTISQAATELGRRPEDVLNLIRCQSLRAVTLRPDGRPEERLRLPETELDRWLRAHHDADPAAIRRRNREAFDRIYRASVESAARIKEKQRIRVAPVRMSRGPSSVRSRETKPRSRLTAAETDRLLARKQKVEALVRRRHGARARRDPVFFTTCSVELDDGIPVSWRFWPATGRREYPPFDAAA